MTTDLKDRFSLADDVDPPELWNEARRRAASPARRPLGMSDRGGFGPGGRRVATAAVAFAVFAAAAVFAWELSHPDLAPQPPPVADEPVDLAAELGPGWTELPPPPEVRSAAATAWTGSQMIMWGGYVFDGSGDKTPTSDGFAFDAASRSWSRLPESPLDARARAGTAWTGTELLVWGGWDGGTGVLGDGAAYDPTAGTWRMLPSAPIEAKAPLSVWTGEEMIIWGTAIRFPSAPMDGAAYDPAANTWRRIADAPIRLTDATAVWTGEEMIVFGASLDGNNHADTPTAVGAAYDPEADTWRELPPSDLVPQATTAAWPQTGEMIAWDYDHATAAYDPEEDAWRALPRVPLRFYECYPESVAIPGHVFGNYCGQLATYAAGDDRWREITREDLQGWVLEPIAAGTAFLVTGHSLELSEEPNVEFDTTMLAWVPWTPDTVKEPREPAPFVPATLTVGDETRMPLVFPDGSRATLVFPTALGLAELGVQPDVSYVSPRGWFPIVFAHGAAASLDHLIDPEFGSRLINTSEGGIEVLKASGNDTEQRFWIRYELPSWTALVSVPDALETAIEVAGAVDLRETASGFPVVEASRSVELAEGFGEASGAQLALGDGSVEPDTVSQLDATIFLSPDGCTTGSESSGTYGSACLGDGSVFASIYGDRDFVNGVIDGLRVEDFVPA